VLPGSIKANCPICGAFACTCKGANEPFVGRPIDLAAFTERADGTMTAIRATEDILRPIPNTVGSYEILYKKGDLISEADAAALGLTAPPPVKDKAKRGPREAPKGPASRDKALTGPKEE
jgi:hypothetical protein